MENGKLYSGLTRLKLMTKRKVGRGGPYFIENVTAYLNIRSPGADFDVRSGRSLRLVWITPG